MMVWLLVGLAWAGWSVATALLLGAMMRASGDNGRVYGEWLARDNETLRNDLCRADARTAYAEAALAEVRRVRVEDAYLHGGRDAD